MRGSRIASRDVHAADEHALVLERDRVGERERLERRSLIEVDAVLEREPRERAVHRARVEVAEAEALGEAARDGALPGPGRAVDGDDHTCSWCLMGQGLAHERWRVCEGTGRFPHSIEEGGPWGKPGFPHGNEPQASDSSKGDRVEHGQEVGEAYRDGLGALGAPPPRARRARRPRPAWRSGGRRGRRPRPHPEGGRGPHEPGSHRDATRCGFPEAAAHLSRFRDGPTPSRAAPARP